MVQEGTCSSQCWYPANVFYGFLVRPDHRDYLRFLWHIDNDLSKEVQEDCMHVFGNSPSPAVMIYCLWRTAQEGEPKFGANTRRFVERHFCVDDGLISLLTEPTVIDLLKCTCASLAGSNLNLHKIASNSVAVMQSFKPEKLTTGIRDWGLDNEILPTQRSLDLCWDIKTDTFTSKVAVANKPCTRQGVLSIINSIFDSLGLAAPVTVRGRLLLWELYIGVQDWDAPLSDERMSQWEAWKATLQELSCLQVPCCYVPTWLWAMCLLWCLKLGHRRSSVHTSCHWRRSLLDLCFGKQNWHHSQIFTATASLI